MVILVLDLSASSISDLSPSPVFLLKEALILLTSDIPKLDPCPSSSPVSSHTHPFPLPLSTKLSTMVSSSPLPSLIPSSHLSWYSEHELVVLSDLQ